jgi:hypothetical protein
MPTNPSEAAGSSVQTTPSSPARVLPSSSNASFMVTAISVEMKNKSPGFVAGAATAAALNGLATST